MPSIRIFLDKNKNETKKEKAHYFVTNVFSFGVQKVK
jgi:hypothetical protein